MPYSEDLHTRISSVLCGQPGYMLISIFGGKAYQVNNYQCCSVIGDKLMAIIGKKAKKKALKHEHVIKQEEEDPELEDIVFVHPSGLQTEEDLRFWLDQCIQFAFSKPEVKPAEMPERKNLREEHERDELS